MTKLIKKKKSHFLTKKTNDNTENFGGNKTSRY